MRVTVNGVPTDVEKSATVGSLVAARGGEHRRVAVAVNGEVVPRSAWPTTALADNDRLEVLGASQGG